MAILKQTRIVLAAAVVTCVCLALVIIGQRQKQIWRLTKGCPSTQAACNQFRLPNQEAKVTGRPVEFQERMLRIQAKRKLQLAQGCKSPLLQDLSNCKSRVRKSLVINVPEPLRLTYCAIPKCGTSSWLYFFEKATNVDCRPGAEVHECARAKFDKPASTDSMLPSSLVVVRNPWRRLVSAYEDKFVTERHRLANSCYKQSGKSLNDSEPISFSQFIRCILEEYRGGRELNVHYAPQYWQCALCQANYSYIGNVETLADDFRYLAMHVFNTSDYEAYRSTFFNSHRRPSEVRNVSTILYEPCYRSLEPNDMAALMPIYQPDAEMFGYPPQPLP